MIATVPQLGEHSDPATVFAAITRLMVSMREWEVDFEELGVVIPNAAITEIEAFRTTIGDLIAHP